ncbi:substrate-binding periplasmic protein [Fluviispira vulneris]|uniref:substrate-binding periplasmic protein n=1 Tax=Fluviispira vulneris TaxID=2763012 RepID=UPI001647FA30|nr:transporter substrate-binding domain-containing protein [Fluviispira vulneris]
MDKFFIKCIFLLLILISISSYAHSNNLYVRGDYWCPYNCNPKDTKPGYLIEILQNTFGKDKINYEIMNWARAIIETRKGDNDVIVGAAKEDAPDLLFSTSLGLSDNCFYALKKSKFKFTGLDALNNVTLGVIKDYSYYKELNDYIKKNINNKNKIAEHFGDNIQERMLAKLMLKRLDIIVEDSNVIDFILKKHPEMNEIVKLKCIEVGKIFIAFSPTKPDSVERVKVLNSRVNEMIKNGEMKNILKKYSIKPWFK